jgi:integrase
MAIVRAPLKTDAAGKCTRWRVIIYNPDKGKQEWHTIAGTRRDAEAYERSQKTRLASGVYISKTARRTLEEVVTLFLKERTDRNRRTNTLAFYESALRNHWLPKFGQREVGTIRRSDIADHLDSLRDQGATVQTINRVLRAMKATLYFALDREMIERNPIARFRPFEGAKPVCARDAFTEIEIRAILAAAKPRERALIGLLCFTGLRPGEAYGLEWSSVDLEAGTLRVLRSWDYRGKEFVAPKTSAGLRAVPLSSWLVGELRAHKARLRDSNGLVFPTKVGGPMNPSNVRRDIWLPLRQRAGVRKLDLYSMRHSFATLARTAGEHAFNVSRVLGHSRSSLVDQVYAAHSLASGMASVAESVTARALGTKPHLRVIDGGARDVRQPLDETNNAGGRATATA